jgi:hypothetical protein
MLTGLPPSPPKVKVKVKAAIFESREPTTAPLVVLPT